MICVLLQDTPAVQAARPQRTEAEAKGAGRREPPETRRRAAEDREPAGIDCRLYDVHADGRTHCATTNANEYWAEGVQWWFFSNYGECFSGNVKVETPHEFAAYDPTLNTLISRVFVTHRIEMDVFHAKRVRAVTCGGADRAP